MEGGRQWKSIKKAEEPEGNFGAEAGLCFIGCDKCVINTLYLSGSFIPAADFKNEFFIDQKIPFC